MGQSADLDELKEAFAVAKMEGSARRRSEASAADKQTKRPGGESKVGPVWEWRRRPR